MKLLRTLIAPLLAVTFVAACGDSTPEEVAEALAGTWNATSVVFTNKANSLNCCPCLVCYRLTCPH